jgi:hypothetical protein
MEHRAAREDEPGWRDAGFDDARWAPARELFRASDPAAPWRLFPRALPPLLEEPLATPPVVQAGLVEPAADAPPFGYAVLPSDVGTGVATLPLELPGDGRVHYVVLDVGRVTNAFVSLELDAPAGATVELMYAESPSLNADKAHRGILDGRRIEGYRDEYVARSGRQCLEPHTRRTFRFLRVAVRSLAGAVTLLRLDLLRTGFPFEELGSFACSDASLDCVWQVGWDTCRLCAHDTYEDSPYYEQLQYVGDARIQALISYVVAGEHRLAEKALVQLAETRDASGFLMARQPARERVVIPGFSLLWIEMLEELHLFTGREELARELLPLTRELLAVFRRHEDPDGCLRDVPMWNFLDWSFEEKGTLQRPGDPCAPITMFYVGALRAAARLHARLGSGEHAAELAARGARTARAVRRGTWSAREGAFFDGVARRSLSRHTNALGLLYGIVDGEPAHRLAERVLSDTRMKPTTFYFDFYVHRAFERLGRADLLLADMDRWRAMLELGATAWFETHGESRSDCHAWSASPTYDLLRAVLGVRVVEPGYAKVRIEPHPGGLGWARGRVATPRGPIEVEWRRGRDFELDVSVPDGVEAEVVRPVLGR